MTGAPELRIEASVGVDGSELLRRRALQGLAVSSALSIALPAIALATSATALCAFACFPAIGLLASLGMLGIAAVPGRASLVRGVVEIEDGHLIVASHNGRIRWRVPLAEIAQGHRELPDLVHIATRAGETLVVQLASSPDEASDRLLHACGVSAAERVLSVPLPSAASRHFGGRFFAGMLLTVVFLMFAMFTIALGASIRQLVFSGSEVASVIALAALFLGALGSAGYGLLRSLGRRTALVGADGVVFRGALRTRRIRYDDVATVTPDRRGVRLHRHHGKSLLIPTSGRESMPVPPREARGPALPEGEATREVLLDRIQDAMEARERGAFARPGLDALDRRGRSVEAWREDLAKISVADGDYRRAGLSPADLGGVIEDASAPGERRIAATVALAASEPVEARRRVRIAVDACADEDLRRAIEGAAEGEIDAAYASREAARRR